ncbi:MAG: DUF5684 domain-containing protein [Halobacteria archaeon]
MLSELTVLQQNGNGVELSIVTLLIIFVVALISWAGAWKVFNKAGHHGWAWILPFLNVYIMCDIGDRNKLLTFIAFIPIVNIFVMFYINWGLTENFGHGIGYALGLTFLPFIFFPILGFGDAEYLDEPGWNHDVTGY